LYNPERAFTSSKIQGVWYNWKIGRLLRRYHPGVVHVHSPYFYGALSFGIKMSGLKSVVHVHLEESKEDLRWALKNHPAVIITCAQLLKAYVRDVLPECYQDCQQIVAVPNAVDTKRFFPGNKAAAKAKFEISQQIPLVLMIANLAPHKGQVTTLRTAALLKS